ncbi:Protein NEDD1 [Rhynchospora pubera]|uniref:Protein NEDD1 n=1 Tax=Rhynchospora pubera TaxID=906938 RepID=A0AAV8FID9_9POAL|nr:Protein NEDD1 [Rhynchospora pubera]
MGYADLTGRLHLATCGGSTVKLFDTGVALSSGGGDPCVLSYSPGAGSVNAVRWNHTNSVTASAGDDKKISFWHKKGQCLAVLPDPGTDVGDNIEESILSISFSNKGSRYLCSGGSGQIVRIWDLQRKKCIKWLAGHSDTITGVMYNCRDEYLASISIRGDLILHNLASGARTAEVKDPHRQVLRVLDYSRLSRHILATAGDDGSVHLWDTTARSPKFSWLKQHTAPTTGLCLSPSSDKIITSVGLDKKLYVFDSGMKKPSDCVPFKEPFSSLAYNDDGSIIAAGTSGGQLVFFDVRAKHQPLAYFRAYNSSEAVTSLSWQRSKPVPVNENCSDEIALLGGTADDSVLMPDPLPSSSLTSATSLAGIRTSLKTTFASKPQALKDEMDVFSPLVDVQPITPSLSKWWEEGDEGKRSFKSLDKRSIDFSDSSVGRKYPLGEDRSVSDVPSWRHTLNHRQDDTSSATGSPSLKNDTSLLRQPTPLSRFGPNAGPAFSSVQEPSTSFNSRSLSQITTTTLNKGSLDSSQPGSTRLSSYAERLSASSAFSEGLGVASPKMKKIGAETREELLNISRQEMGRTVPSVSGASTQPATNGVAEQPVHALNVPILDQQVDACSSSFSRQLAQRTLEETLGAVQKSICEDVHNLHLDLIRQVHMLQMDNASSFSKLQEKVELQNKEIQLLRQEIQQLQLHQLR